jgi:hypothetical protein
LLHYRSCFVSSIFRILVLGCVPSWCTLKFTACFDVLHSTAHTRVRRQTLLKPLFPNGSRLWTHYIKWCL